MKKIINKLIKHKGLILIVLLFLSVLFSAKSSIAESLLICDIDATDQEGNDYTFSLTKTAPGISIEPDSGIISGDNTMTFGTHIIETRVTDEYGAISDPYAFAFIVDSYCGDNIIENPNTEGRGGPLDDGVEECDGKTGIAFTPADSGPNKTYACTGDCPETATDCLDTCKFANDAEGGGYCGDGVVQAVLPSGLPGEDCDPAETRTEYIARTGDTSALNDAKWRAISLSCDAADCSIDCSNISDIGLGCYIDSDNSGSIEAGECQKGMFICDATNDSFKCDDVYSDIASVGHAVFDECCEGDVDELSDGNVSGSPFTRVRASTLDMIPSGFFNCDQVCKKTNKICVGVGLANYAVNSCISVINHFGAVCDSPVNITANDCKSSYRTGTIHCTESAPGGQGFMVGESLCYCL